MARRPQRKARSAQGRIASRNGGACGPNVKGAASCRLRDPGGEAARLNIGRGLCSRLRGARYNLADGSPPASVFRINTAMRLSRFSQWVHRSRRHSVARHPNSQRSSSGLTSATNRKAINCEPIQLQIFLTDAQSAPAWRPPFERSRIDAFRLPQGEGRDKRHFTGLSVMYSGRTVAIIARRHRRHKTPRYGDEAIQGFVKRPFATGMDRLEFIGPRLVDALS